VTGALFARPVLLLDGGMGRELRLRGVELHPALWSASALLAAPDVVRQIHADYLAAGADVITTNTYGVIRAGLARVGLEPRFAELTRMAARLARQARDAAGRPALIAGSLPPLRGSYRPDLVGSFDVLAPLYAEQAALLAPDVDLLLCETMSSAAEGRAAAWGATRTGKPVWVAWTLHEDRSGRLRSGETVTEAARALHDLPVSGCLVNCAAPESVTQAMPELVGLGAGRVGGYANTFAPVAETWTLESGGVLPLRHDLDPEAYARHAGTWLAAGATAVGGCCGTRPAHIARLRALLAAWSPPATPDAARPGRRHARGGEV
jgi:S-methylmethionine-dependent homocysteine/selenocysteine methylase